jgi:hypothetical protein
MVKWLTLLLHFKGAPGSNLGTGTSYSEEFYGAVVSKLTISDASAFQFITSVILSYDAS